MIQEVTTSPGFKLSKKCASCGLTNFAAEEKCKRCDADLSAKSVELKAFPVNDPKPAASKMRFSVICGVVLVMFGALGALYIVTKRQGGPEAVNQAKAGGAATSNVEQEVADPAEERARSKQAAASVTSQLKRIQEATTNSKLSFEEYEQLLTQLTAEVNRALPSFTGRGSGDETFRAEVNAAIREYRAAKDWWKTTIRYGSALDETESKNRLLANWESAKTHLSNAEAAVRD